MDEFLDILLKEEVLIRGHFLLSSGLHSEWYFEKMRLVENPSLLSLFIKELLKKTGKDFDKVVGPFKGGAIVAYEVARQLNIRCAFAEKVEDKMLIRRGKGIKGKDRVLVVDDVLTTGGSLLKTVKAVEEKGGEVVKKGVLIDRSEKDIGTDYEYVVKYSIKNYSPSECPLCRDKKPLIKPGG